MKLIINFPIAVDADIESHSSEFEAGFNVNSTDFIRLTNITLPKALTVPASCVAVAETDEG